jgi:glycosyltransferase involved in cell wall biosynthesis
MPGPLSSALPQAPRREAPAPARKARLHAWTHAQLAGNPLVSELHGLALMAKARLPVGRRARLSALLTAGRRLRLRLARRWLKRELAPFVAGNATGACREERVEWDRYFRDFDIGQKALTTSLLLKEPGPGGEKGVLYSSFEYNWMRLVVHYDARRFFDQYYLVGASSWSPMDYASLANLAGLSPDPVFIGVSNVTDVADCQVMAPAIQALPLMACDWINPAYYTPRARSEREIDILMVANWMPFKRHWLLFEALKDMRRDLRVVLIGRNGPGRTEKELRAEARAHGARQDIEYLTDVGIEEVTAHQCNARVAVLLSQREGSCVSTTECFFAGTPVAMMRDAHVGSKAYINERTGILMARRGLARTLSRFLEESDRFTPRAWAEERITCFDSSRRLNQILRAHARRSGQPWTRDIAPLCWRYVPAYADPADEPRLAPAVERLRAEHGLELVKFRHRAS